MMQPTAALQEQLHLLPNLELLRVYDGNVPGRPELTARLVRSLPPTLRSLEYKYHSSGFGGRLLPKQLVLAEVPSHMQLIEWHADRAQ
jgi:hypothetical protein